MDTSKLKGWLNITGRCMKESDIQKAILECLWYNHVFAWRNNTGAFKDGYGNFVRFGKVGSCDILGVLPNGRFLAIEVKMPKKNPTDAQKEFMEKVNEHGGLAFVARSVDDVTEMLKKVVHISSLNIS